MSPRPRFYKLDPKARERLLAVAADEFAADGYESASLNRIIERSGMSKGAIYYYFDDKADLFATVVDDAVGRLEPVLEHFAIDTLTAADFWGACREQYRRALHLAFEQPSLIGVLRAAAHLGRDQAEGGPLGPIYRRLWDWMSALLARGRALGAVRSDAPEALVMDVVFAVGTAAELWLLSAWDQLPDEGRDEAIGWVFSMFRRVAETGDH